ncbi:MAG: M15 family metallopeptidase [Rugosibacter sp.]|jgi:peptidoglycan L-alanyl-D-glutamate endopeptidase CwlK|nr:peptidoglycan LD-endopeptidase CwlK [Rugosibacter sp.]
MKIEDIIAAVQTKLNIQIDGRAGPETWEAIYAYIVKPDAVSPAEAAEAVEPGDPRSEKNIATLQPEVQPIARALIEKASLSGIRIKVISGLRTFAEQDALYGQGRTKPGAKVTNARGGYSNHNFGIAFDVGVFEGNKYLADSPKYKAVGALGMDLGLEWGGNWKTMADQPHFQLRPAWASGLGERELLAGLRMRAAEGMPVFA